MILTDLLLSSMSLAKILQFPLDYSTKAVNSYFQFPFSFHRFPSQLFFDIKCYSHSCLYLVVYLGVTVVVNEITSTLIILVLHFFIDPLLLK